MKVHSTLFQFFECPLPAVMCERVMDVEHVRASPTPAVGEEKMVRKEWPNEVGELLNKKLDFLRICNRIDHIQTKQVNQAFRLSFPVGNYDWIECPAPKCK